MRKYDIAIIDFETMNSDMNSPCEVGITLINDSEIVDTYSSYINPKNNIYNLQNAKIHNISKETILNSPRFDVVYKDIEYYLKESQIVVAHNAHFDISVLKNTLDDHAIDFPDFLYIDSILIFKDFLELPSYNMKNLCEYYGLPTVGLHSAKVDTEKLATLLILLTKELYFNRVLEMILLMDDNRIKLSKYINPLKSLMKSDYYPKTMKISEVNQMEIVNSNKNLTNKNIVFTGTFEIEKDNLMIKARQNGATIRSTVTKNTDFLVEGKQEERYMDENGLVAKQRKARELISQGFEITLLDEKDFLHMIGGI